MGKKRTAETLKKLSEAHKGYVIPSSQKEKIRLALLGRKRPKEVIEKIIASKRQSVIIKDVITSSILEVESTQLAAQYCKCHIETLYKKIKTQTLINKRYKVYYKKDIVES